MRRSPQRPGYTLLEVILVMAILIILMAVSLPTMYSMYGDTRIRGAADEIRGAWAEARTRAIDTGNPFRFAVEKDKDKYRIAPDGPEFWDGSKGPSEENSDDGNAKIGSLPHGITFEPPSGAHEDGGWVSVAIFLPDGTCKEDAKVVVREGGEPLAIVLRVRGLTGVVSVKTSKQDEEDR